MADFYLISGERPPESQYAPRACTILRRLRNEIRDDLALVRVDPPIPWPISYGDVDGTDLLLLATRWNEHSLFPLSEGPVHVYIGHLNYRKDEPIPDDVDSNFETKDWGTVFRTKEEAEESQRLHLEGRWSRPLP